MTNVTKVKNYLNAIEVNFEKSGLRLEDFLSNIIGAKSYTAFKADTKENISAIINAMYQDLDDAGEESIDFCIKSLEYIKKLLLSNNMPNIADVHKQLLENYEVSVYDKDTTDEDGKRVLTIDDIHGAYFEKAVKESLVEKISVNPFGLAVYINESTKEIEKFVEDSNIINVNTMGQLVRCGMANKFIGANKDAKKTPVELAVCAVLSENMVGTVKVGYSIVLPKAVKMTKDGCSIETENFKHFFKIEELTKYTTGTTFRVLSTVYEGSKIFIIAR